MASKECLIKERNLKRSLLQTYTDMQRGYMTTKTGRDIASIFQDFSLVVSSMSANDRNALDKVSKYKYALMDSANDMINKLTNGAITSMDDLASVSDERILYGVLDEVKSMTERIVRYSKDVNALAKLNIEDEFRSILKGAQYANYVGLGLQKLFSGHFVSKLLPEYFDGLILRRDVVFKQNATVDYLRMLHRSPSGEMETRTSYLQSDFVKLTDNITTESIGINKLEALNLLKYFDSHYNPNGDLKALENNIKDRIASGHITKTIDDENEYIKLAKDKLSQVYEMWKVFNYGTANPEKINYFKDWTRFTNSYNFHIIKSGTNYVSAFVESIEKGYVDRSTYDAMNNKEKALLGLFAKYYFDSLPDDKVGGIENDTLKSKFKNITRLDPDSEDNSYKVRMDYVPFLREDKFSEKIMYDDSDALPSVSFLGERTGKDIDEANHIGITENLLHDLASFKGLIVRSSELMFARTLNNLVNTDREYARWSAEPRNAFVARQLKIFARNTIKANSPSTKPSKGLELFRQTLMCVLGMENAVTLTFSGIKNRLQGMQGLSLNMSSDEIYSKLAGNLSFRRISENAGLDKTSFDISNIVDEYLERSITARRAETQLFDTEDAGLVGGYSRFLQMGFNFVEQSNMYGAFTLPRFMYKKLKGQSAVANNAFALTGAGKWLTNYGSEKALRDFRKVEALNYVMFNYTLDAKMLESNNVSDEDKSRIKSKWGSGLNDTVIKIIEDSKFELYEKDNKYFGDFGPDTKPFYSHEYLRNGDNAIKVFLGFCFANWYMFRQASSFGLDTTIMSMARAIGEVSYGKKLNVSAPLFAPAATLAIMLNEYYDSMFGDEYSMTSQAFTAFNQGQDVGMVLKPLTMLMAMNFDLPVSETAHKNMCDQLARWGGGMLAGKTLQSIVEDADKDLSPLTTMMQSWKNSAVHAPLAMAQLISAKTSKEIGESKKYLQSAYGLTFPAIDNIVGGNNDIIRQFVNGLYGLVSTYKTSVADESERKDLAQMRNKLIMKPIKDLLGMSVLEVMNNRKDLEIKGINDVEEQTFKDILDMNENSQLIREVEQAIGANE